MKIVHLSESDIGSGAAQAAYRIHRGMRELGEDSIMLVGVKRSNDPSVRGVCEGAFGGMRARSLTRLNACPQYFYRHRPSPPSPFSNSLFTYGNVEKRPEVRTADAICLYWVAGAYLAPEALRHIHAPVVWRLSDMWPFTGGCHYAGDCRRYENACGACPELGSARGDDLSRRNWQSKARGYRDANLTIVAPSRWLAECARRSALFRDRRIEVIPTGVNLERFKPYDKNRARKALGLPEEGRLILFGALDVGDKRKGFAALRKALSELAGLAAGKDCRLVVVGGRRREDGPDLPLPLHEAGVVRDEKRLALLYSAADVAAVPSLEDNLPNVALEAIACGTPVVAFGAAGMPDIVDHHVNGYLAQPYDVQDLARGLDWVLAADAAQSRAISAAARQKAETRFCAKKQAETYRELFWTLAEPHLVKGQP